ncbi:hypothetical protein DIRU0_D18162 [Diutina rugosa]
MAGGVGGHRGATRGCHISPVPTPTSSKLRHIHTNGCLILSHQFGAHRTTFGVVAVSAEQAQPRHAIPRPPRGSQLPNYVSGIFSAVQKRPHSLICQLVAAAGVAVSSEVTRSATREAISRPSQLQLS